jgi:RecA/RadA recombinase
MIAMVTDAEADASMEKEQMGVNAKFWNKAMRKITTAMNRNPERCNVSHD